MMPVSVDALREALARRRAMQQGSIVLDAEAAARAAEERRRREMFSRSPGPAGYTPQTLASTALSRYAGPTLASTALSRYAGPTAGGVVTPAVQPSTVTTPQNTPGKKKSPGKAASLAGQTPWSSTAS